MSEATASLELTYRSDAALLVAYATHLIRGHLPVQTTARLPNGTTLHLRLVAPATSISLSGVVTGVSGSTEIPEVALSVTSRAEVLGEASSPSASRG